MKFHGITLQEGSTVANMTLASGTSFPSNPNEGELFFRSDSDVSVRGMYGYIGGNWDRLASADAITVPSASNFPASANIGDLFYKDSNDANEALYVYTGSAWVATGNSGGTSVVDGDLSGTIAIGSTTTLTLDSIVTAATAGSASKTVTVTIDAKGRVTSLSEQNIAIDASQVTSGTFDNARIAQSNVTQHQSALNIGASQVTSGTFADARIAQSNVTQHEAALTIAETQITNGSLLARVADNETISGNWAFNGTVSGQTPTSGAHLVTKDYADALATGLDFKQSVKAATTSNITLSGSQTIDGVAISAGMRVLVKDQTDATENGIYVAAAGSWSRSSDADNTPSNEVTAGMFCYVEEGTVNADSGWVLATNDTITLGSTNLVFTQFTGLGQITAGNGLTKTGNTLNVGGNAGRIVVNADDIDLATVTDSGTGSFKKVSVDSYGRVTGTTNVVSSDITSLVDATYVNVSGDTMTGLLTISRAGNGLVVTSTDGTAANNSGIILNTTASPTASSRVATIVLDANGADGAGGDYVTLNAFGSGDFTINNRNAAAITFQTNATERARIDSSGRVGINQTSLDATLNVDGTVRIGVESPTTAFKGLILASTLTDTFTVDTDKVIHHYGITMKSFSDAPTSPQMVMSSYFGFRLYTTGAERMRIDSAGRVGISTVPLSTTGGNGNTLQVGDPASVGGTGITLGSTAASDIQFSRATTGANQYAGLIRYNHTGDYLALWTASTERARISSVGNLGVGTIPNSNYRIHASSTGSNQVASQGTTDASFITNVNGTQSLYLHSTASMSEINELRALPLLFTVNSAERARFDSSGNLYMQTGNIYMNTSTTGIHSGSGSWPLIMGINGTEKVRIDSSGNFLVGTTSANYGTANRGLIEVNGSTDSLIAFKRSNASKGYLQAVSDDGLLLANVTATGYMAFNTNSNERMRIDSSGRVGIGAVPGAKLDVVDSSSDVIIRAVANNTTGAAVQQLTAGNGTTSSNYAYTYYLNSKTTPQSWKVGTYGNNNYTIRDDTAASNRLTIDTSGNVGINMATSMTYKLEIGAGGVLALNDSTNANKGTLQMSAGGLELYTGASKYIVFGTNSAERMRIDSSGNVGIGVTPSAWGTLFKVVQVGSKGVIASPSGASSGTYFGQNWYSNSSNVDTYVTTGPAGLYGISGSVHSWYSAASGAADTVITFVKTMTLDDKGNLGLGVTPSAWGGGAVGLQIGVNGSLYAFTASGTTNPFVGIGSNTYSTSTSVDKYIGAGAAASYSQYLGQHRWWTAPVGAAGGTITWTQAMALDASGNLLLTGGGGGLGYGTGSGGTVTQATSKTTGVTLNKPSGQITLNNAAIAAGGVAAFTFTNSTIAANDVVSVCVKSGMATGGSYNISVDAVNAGSCNISVRNMTGGSLSEALVLNFAVIKGAAA